MEGLDQALWRRARLATLERDSFACTVREWDDTPCSGGPIHVHHSRPDVDPYDVDHLFSCCAAHHARWHHLQRQNERRLQPA